MKDAASAAQVTLGLDLGDRHTQEGALDEIGEVREQARPVAP